MWKCCLFLPPVAVFNNIRDTISHISLLCWWSQHKVERCTCMLANIQYTCTGTQNAWAHKYRKKGWKGSFSRAFVHKDPSNTGTITHTRTASYCQVQHVMWRWIRQCPVWLLKSAWLSKENLKRLWGRFPNSSQRQMGLSSIKRENGDKCSTEAQYTINVH